MYHNGTKFMFSKQKHSVIAYATVLFVFLNLIFLCFPATFYAETVTSSQPQTTTTTFNDTSNVPALSREYTVGGVKRSILVNPATGKALGWTSVGTAYKSGMGVTGTASYISLMEVPLHTWISSGTPPVQTGDGQFLHGYYDYWLYVQGSPLQIYDRLRNATVTESDDLYVNNLGQSHNFGLTLWSKNYQVPSGETHTYTLDGKTYTVNAGSTLKVAFEITTVGAGTDGLHTGVVLGEIRLSVGRMIYIDGVLQTSKDVGSSTYTLGGSGTQAGTSGSMVQTGSTAAGFIFGRADTSITGTKSVTKMVTTTNTEPPVITATNHTIWVGQMVPGITLSDGVEAKSGITGTKFTNYGGGFNGSVSMTNDGGLAVGFVAGSPGVYTQTLRADDNTDATSSTTTRTITVLAAASVQKTSDATRVKPGDVFTWSITASNASPNPITVNIEDTLHNGLIILSVSDDSFATINGQNVKWQGLTVPAAGTKTVTIQVKVKADNGGTAWSQNTPFDRIPNTATVVDQADSVPKVVTNPGPEVAVIQVTISKTIAGPYANLSRTFPFIITLMDSNGNTLPSGTVFQYTGGVLPGSGATAPANGTLTLDALGQATISLGHGQTISIAHVSAGGKISILEGYTPDYTTTFKDSADGVVVAGSSTGVRNLSDTARTFEFVNTRNAIPGGISTEGNEIVALSVISLLTLLFTYIVWQIGRRRRRKV